MKRKLFGKAQAECLKYLYYWPVFGLLFYCFERVWIREDYHLMDCALDNAIPFCEYFLIPYLFWFLFLVGIHVYTFFRETDAFQKLMKFITVSYSLALCVFALYPSRQELRPVEFERDNIFTRFLEEFYQFDTNTNVCPSLHVIGSVAVLLCAWNSRRFCTPGWRMVFTVTAALISASTVFLKQHSVMDVAAAIPICWISYRIAYGEKVYPKFKWKPPVRRRVRATAKSWK